MAMVFLNRVYNFNNTTKTAEKWGMNVRFKLVKNPSLNVFYQLMTMFDRSVDQFFHPDMGADDACKKRINVMLNSMDEKELHLVENLIRAVKDASETEGA